MTDYIGMEEWLRNLREAVESIPPTSVLLAQALEAFHAEWQAMPADQRAAVWQRELEADYFAQFRGDEEGVGR